MRQLILACLLIPGYLLAKQITLTITPDASTGYNLTPTYTKLICSSLQANLSSDALSSLGSLSGVPFTCSFSKDDDGTKHIIITLALSDD